MTCSQYLTGVLYAPAQTSSVSQSTSGPKPSRVLCPKCNKACGRPQDVWRHVLSAHLPCWLHCPYSPCPWRGHRKENFKTHLRAHPGADPNFGPFHVYETKVILGWIKDGTPVEIAAAYALGFVSEKAHELGLVEDWENLWGGREKKVQCRRSNGRSTD